MFRSYRICQQLEDCDDTVSHVNPNALEVCDGLDGDCDGVFPVLKRMMMEMDMSNAH